MLTELTEMCAHLHNYFCRSAKDKHFGTFEISGGAFLEPLDFLQNGQYYRIINSVFNDGVHQVGNPDDVLKDEKFKGAIWAMSVPADFLALVKDVKAYNDSEEAKPSSYTSESFDGYSRTKATDKNGAPVNWDSIFASRLGKWRKLR